MSTILTLHHPAQAERYYASGVWQRDTLYTLLAKHAAERGEDYALRDAQRRITWSQLQDWVDALAADLAQAGVRCGERVSVWLPSRAEAVVALLACSRNGYICNASLHQNYTVAEILALLERIDSKVLIAQQDYGADAAQHDLFAAARERNLKRLYRLAPHGVRADLQPGEHAFPAAGDGGSDAPVDHDPDKVIYLAFTSGTTGLPKAVMHSDNTLLANGRAMVRDWHHDHRTVLLSLSPLSHHIATVAVEQMLVTGLELVVNDRPGGMRVLDWILASNASYVMGVPTHAIDVLGEMRQRGLSQLGAVKVFYMAGAPIPPETARAFLSLGITPQNIYGMTENGSHHYTLPSDTAQTITETCGRACHGYEVAIWKQDNGDELAAPGEVGEIGGRGGVLMLGYFNNQKATEESFNRHGWFMSGDLGMLDANGCLRILGRKKDLIIRGGHNIYPARIEELALRHPAVQKAAAFAVSDTRLGEKVCLAVIPVSTQRVDGAELLQHLAREGLSKYDMPEYFAAMENFPLTASGKILKRELTLQANAGKLALEPIRYIG